MASSLSLDASEPAPVGRPVRVLLAVLASLVLLAVLSLIELGVLTLLTVASSAMNHGSAS